MQSCGIMQMLSNKILKQRTLFPQTLNCKKKREGDYIDKRDLKKHFKHTLMFSFYVDHYSHKPITNILLVRQSGKFLHWYLMRLRNCY